MPDSTVANSEYDLTNDYIYLLTFCYKIVESFEYIYIIIIIINHVAKCSHSEVAFICVCERSELFYGLILTELGPNCKSN